MIVPITWAISSIAVVAASVSPWMVVICREIVSVALVAEPAISRIVALICSPAAATVCTLAGASPAAVALDAGRPVRPAKHDLW